MPIRFTKELLEQIIERDCATLIGEYPHINRETRISFKCKCGEEFSKNFRCLFEDTGAFCKLCTVKNTRIKTKSTNLERYGVEAPSQNKDIQTKARATNLERYGVEVSSQNKDVYAKVKATNLERYGVESATQNKEVQAKARATNLERYGSENPFQNKEVQAKAKATNLERYGAENPFQSEICKEKIKETNLERLGVEYPSQNQEVRDKVKATNLERLGVEYPSQNQEVREKVKATNLERLGVEYPTQNQEVRDKCKATSLERYGVEYPNQNQEIMERNQKNSFSYKQFIMPSGEVRIVQGYEPFALKQLVNIYSEDQIKTGPKNVPRIQYEFEEEKKYHFPDIFIPHENKIIEVKSLKTYEWGGDKVLLKKKAAEEQGFLYEIWFFDEKGQRVEV